jgi:hypothetical protein
MLGEDRRQEVKALSSLCGGRNYRTIYSEINNYLILKKEKAAGRLGI